MRFVGSLIKYFIYLCVILIASGAALFWFDTGSWLVHPVAEKAADFFLHPMKLSIKSVNGSVKNGFTIEGLQLTSGDEQLAAMNHFSVSPDWDLVLSGMNGLPFIKSLHVQGVSSDLDKVMKIASRFASSENETETTSSPLNLNLNPSDISIKNVWFGSPYANLELDAMTLNEAGKFLLDAKILSRDKILPLKADADLTLSPLAVTKSKLVIGEKGTGSFAGSIQPLNVKLFLTALSLGEFAKFSPVEIDADGRIDAKIFAEEKNGGVAASGVVSMPRADVMNIPLNFRLPFTWNGKNIFTIDKAALNTKAAALNLSAKGDIEEMRFTADGEGHNISLTEIGKLFAPKTELYGEGGHVKFDIDTKITEDIMKSLLQQTRAAIKAELPSVSAMGIKAAENLNADIKLTPNQPPKISMGGRAFGGKIFARGEAAQNSDGTIKPQGVVMSIVGLDVPSVINTFPDLAKTIGKTSGKITATARISENLDINAKLTSERLSAQGVTLSSINAEAFYDVNTNKAEIKTLHANLGKGEINANAQADLKTGRFTAEANADNIDLRNIPQLKQATGIYALKADASGNFNDTRTIRADALLTAKNAGYTGVKIGDAEIPVTFRDNVITVANANASLPNGSANVNAVVNIKDSTFRADADVQELEMKFIPGMSQISGKYSLKADASGKFTEIHSIRADANIKARNAGFQGMNFGNADIPITLRESVLSIHNAAANLPGGSVNLKGTANLRNMANPALDFTASTNGINLEQLMNALKLQDKSMPLSGRVKGSAGIKGPLNTAAMTADFSASNIKAGDVMTLNSANLSARTDMKMSTFKASLKADGLKAAGAADISSAAIDAEGNMKRIKIKNVNVKANGAELIGNGVVYPDMKNITASAVDVDAALKNFDIKATLKKFMEKPPVEGVIDAKAGLTGTLSQPAVDLQVMKPVLYGKNEIHDIALKVKSPNPNHYMINAKARIDNFKPETDVDVKIKNGVVYYVVDTEPLDINSAIELQAPEMAGIAKGKAVVHVEGSTGENAPINVTAKSKGVTIMDKISINDINLPVTYLTSKNRVEMKKGTATLSGGEIRTAFDADLSGKTTEWNGSVNIAHLDFGKLAAPFMPEGELIGSVDAQVNMKGSSTMGMNLSFADGKFKTGPGCIQKIAILDKITPTKKITFEEINGTFFWDGRDLFLNPGTGARAGLDEPLYRYFTINGACGIPGKGMRLLCDGRFDLKILDRLLGAMKGVFQYMTGSLARDVLRDAASRVIGLKRKDFQNVTFTLANSPMHPHLKDLKVTKPIEDFLPIDILNKNEEKQKESAQFKMSIRIPVGKGSQSGEEESATDQFKQQLIDNLFNIGM